MIEERVSAMPVQVINPFTGQERYVMVRDHHDAACIQLNGWEIVHHVRMELDGESRVRVVS